MEKKKYMDELNQYRNLLDVIEKIINEECSSEEPDQNEEEEYRQVPLTFENALALLKKNKAKKIGRIPFPGISVYLAYSQSDDPFLEQDNHGMLLPYLPDAIDLFATDWEVKE